MSSSQPAGSVLARLLAAPGRPRVTWYDDEERVELSGHVLDNWVAKTTNLLAEELDVGPGSTVLVDLPGHWRTIVWWLAVLRSGACLATVREPGTQPDVVVTTEPDAWPSATELVVVTLPALARRATLTLPAGAIDAAAAVMTYADTLGPVLDPAPGDPVLRTGPPEARGSVVAADLLDWAARTADLPRLRLTPLAEPSIEPAGASTVGDQGARRHLIAADVPADRLLAACLTILAGDGSLVLCSAAMVDGLRAEPERLARLRSAERVTD